jgi:hypothetical protein
VVGATSQAGGAVGSPLEKLGPWLRLKRTTDRIERQLIKCVEVTKPPGEAA